MSGRRIISLTTDFGLADAYVGIMKGVILAIASDCAIVDLSHEVRPQHVSGAAYLLVSAYRYFPPSTIHLAVVDPGVGTMRRAIALHTPEGYFVGPDNGLFCPVLAAQGLLDLESGELSSEVTAVELTEEKYWLDHVSQTFHGRDIFAPAAAHLAAGTSISELGASITSVQLLAQQAPRAVGDALHGMIIHVDRFGNAISNIPRESLPERPMFHLADRTLEGLSTSYQEARVVAIVGSTGLVEIAARNGSAADALGLRVGDTLVVRGAP